MQVFISESLSLKGKVHNADVPSKAYLVMFKRGSNLFYGAYDKNGKAKVVKAKDPELVYTTPNLAIFSNARVHDFVEPIKCDAYQAVECSFKTTTPLTAIAVLIPAQPTKDGWVDKPKRIARAAFKIHKHKERKVKVVKHAGGSSHAHKPASRRTKAKR